MISLVTRSIIFWSVIAFLGSAFLARFFTEKMTAVRTEHGERIKRLMLVSASARAQSQMDAHLAISRRKEQNRDEIQKAWGTGAIAVTKDPELSIGEMLQGIGSALAPKGSKVAVSVDRFTEFALSIELPSSLSIPQLSGISIEIMELGTPYLHQLTFFSAGRLIGELDCAAVTQGGALLPVTTERIAELLVSGRGEPQAKQETTPAMETSIAGAPAEGEPTTYATALNEWTDGYNAQITGINHNLKTLIDALDLSKLKTKSEVTARIKATEQAGRELAKARSYFAGCLPALEAKLSGEFDPLVVTITMRDVTSRNGKQVNGFQRSLPEMLLYQAHVRRALRELETHAADWKISPDGKIQFSNSMTVRVVNAEIDAANGRLRNFNAKLSEATQP